VHVLLGYQPLVGGKQGGEVEKLRAQVAASKPQLAELEAARSAHARALTAAEQHAAEMATLQQRVAECGWLDWIWM
jgi:hypothetical protein